MKTLVRLAVFFLAAQGIVPQNAPVSPETWRALDSISADSLRGHLSFIASDLLEGRDTPSRGLDIAAAYIAAQFRRAGLEPVSAGGYFQTAKMLRVSRSAAECELRLLTSSGALAVSGDRLAVITDRPLDLSGAPVYKIAAAAQATAEAMKGKVVLLVRAGDRKPAEIRAIAALRPAAFLETTAEDGSPAWPRLIDADDERQIYGDVPRLIVRSPDAVELLEHARNGGTGISVSMKLSAPAATLATVSNVAGLLRGSDAVMRDSYVLLTAHYDHLGRDSGGAVYPGANDDGSGTVSVIEVAQALSRLPVHPKRSIVFLAFFGEEEDSLGSKYYARHPLFPLAKTVADLNLEQLGRTDSNAGPEISNATLTGFDYSSLPLTLQQAGALTGVTVYATPNGDDYYDRSDNQTFAEHGIPAHTLGVAFEFPDYHATGDAWQKIDYGNMAKVDRMIALGLVMLANSAEPPRWNSENPKVERYLTAK